MRILVVDDSPTMRRIVENALEQLGYDDIVEAGNGIEAAQRIREDEIDLLITDWTMPEMDGLELVKAVRRDENHADMPVLMVASRGLTSDVITALKARVDSYLVKPFDTEVLGEKITKVIEKRSAEEVE